MHPGAHHIAVGIDGISLFRSPPSDSSFGGKRSTISELSHVFLLQLGDRLEVHGHGLNVVVGLEFHFIASLVNGISY